MEKTVKEIVREALVELGNIMMYAFDNGVNMNYNTRNSDTESPWITGSVTLEGWHDLETHSQGFANRNFEIYEWMDEDAIRTTLEKVHANVEELSKFDIKKVDTLVAKEVEE